MYVNLRIIYEFNASEQKMEYSKGTVEDVKI